MKSGFSKQASEQSVPVPAGPLRVLFARALIGVIVLIGAEVLSGASLPLGLWHPWTILVTYWLYFAHFFFFTTLAVRTGRTSLPSLYLWGVLFGLYESWITKVIWHGYAGDGKLAMGSIGPYGFSEISMVFFFHPMMSFVLPLTVASLLYPGLRSLFPDLAWFTGKSKGAHAIWFYVLLSFVPIMAMNSGGVINLAANMAVALLLLLLLLRLAKPTSTAADARRIVNFGRFGFTGLCAYLIALYGLTYFLVRPDGLPSVPVQLFTFVFYALAVSGLWLQRRREPVSIVPVEKREVRLVVTYFAALLVFSLACTMLTGMAVLYPIIFVNFVIWTIGGSLLTVLCWFKRLSPVS